MTWNWSDQGTPPGNAGIGNAIGTVINQDRPNVFAFGDDAHLWVNWWDGDAWRWSDQGLCQGPGVIGTGMNQDHPNVFVRGDDGHLWANWFDGGAWRWSDQGTPDGHGFDGGAIGTLICQDRLYVFVFGDDGHLWVNWWDGDAWRWRDQGTPDGHGFVMPGEEVNAIGTLSYQDRPYVFVRGDDGHLWVNWWDGDAWRWRDQGTPDGHGFDGHAIGTLSYQDSLYVFVPGDDLHLWVNWWDGGPWRWSDQGIAPGPFGRPGHGFGIDAIGTLSHKDQLYVFVRGLTLAQGAVHSHLLVNWWL